MIMRRGSGDPVTVGDTVVDGKGRRYYVESIRALARKSKIMVRAVSLCGRKQRVHASPEYFNLKRSAEYYRAGWGEVTITEGDK